jgi:DNA-binding MarR family transcriptional regulator
VRSVTEVAREQELVQEWRGLAERYAVVSCALERALHDEHGLGVSEFEVLDRLAEDDEPKRRVQELAEMVHLSQSALSRVVARLEREELVCRSMCPEDRRGIFVRLTEIGQAKHVEARDTQRRVLANMLVR